MRLEEELKQEKFQSEHQKALLNILVTGNWLESDSSKRLKPLGISLQQFNVLRILKGQESNAISVNDIMTRMIDKMSNASRLVEKLRRKDLIERVTNERDRRQVDVKITVKGLDLLQKATIEMDALVGEFAKITTKEAEILSDILERIRL